MKIKSKIRRILCSVLSILMIIPLCPVTAGASTNDIVEFTAYNTKDMAESFKEIETVTEIPASFDYELGSEDVIYSSSYGDDTYAKLVKVEIAEEEVGKSLYIKFEGKNEAIGTYVYLFRQNGNSIEYVTKTNEHYMIYDIESAGTYYIALAGFNQERTGLCHTEIKLVEKKDMIESFKEIETVTEIPASFDYEFGSEDVIYTSSYTKDIYAKLVKVEVTEQEIGKNIYISVVGKNIVVKKYLYLFKQNGDSIEYVTKTSENYMTYDIESAGIYYIALAGYNGSCTGLCHAEIKLVEIKDRIDSLKEIETVTDIPASFDYEIGSENTLYNKTNGSVSFSKLLKINIQDSNTLLDIRFVGKDRYVNTYVSLYKETANGINCVDGNYGINKKCFIPKPGIYYLDFEVLPGESGLCNIEINSSVIDDCIFGNLDFTSRTIPVPEEGALWSWDSDTNTLTLKDGFNIISNSDRAIILPEDSTVIVDGKADIFSSLAGILSSGSLTIIGNGMDNSLLNLYSDSDCIFCNGKLTIRDCSFDFTSGGRGIRANRADEDVFIERSKIDIVSRVNGISTYGGDVVITDSNIYIDARYNGVGIRLGCEFADANLSVNSSVLIIKSRYETINADGIILTDVKVDIRSLSSFYYIMYMNNYSDFSIPGTFYMFDINGNELYEGEWKSEMLSNEYICVNGVLVNGIVSVCGHDWSNEWTSDSIHHWHECNNAYCIVTDNALKNGYDEHTSELINAVKPSDTTEGYTGDTVCKVCGYIISCGTVIPKIGWKKNATGWWYDNGDGIYPKDTWKNIAGNWYYFDESGYIVTGWFKDGDSWYYFETNGKMATGWKEISDSWYFFETNGKMATGWKGISGKWYYFESNGKMAANKWVNTNYYVKANGVMATDEWVDGDRYYVDANGKWVPNKTKAGWKKNETGWWYDNGDSTYPKSEWKSIDGSWYYFNASGYIVTGWFADGGSWYYFESNGKMAANKWINSVYYVKADGAMAVSEWVDGNRYYVGADGKWVPGKTA